MKHLFLRRIVCIALVLLLACSALTSCSSARAIKPTAEDTRVVATCAGYDICYDELRYITRIYHDEYVARYGEDVWTDAEKAAAYLPQFTNEVTDALKINASILLVCADFGISLEDDDIQDTVQAEIAATIKALGSRAIYKQMLKDMYMTDRFARYTIATDLCESALAQNLISAELIISSELDFMEYAMNDDNMCATYHIFIGNDAGESVEQNRAIAEQVHDMIRNGTALTSLIGSSYNDDVYAPSTPYYFMKTEYDEAYESASFALEIGQLSEVVETSDGFYIIERQPLSESYIVANLTELLQRYQYAEVEGLIADQRATLTVEWTDFGKELNLLDIE